MKKESRSVCECERSTKISQNHGKIRREPWERFHPEMEPLFYLLLALSVLPGTKTSLACRHRLPFFSQPTSKHFAATLPTLHSTTPRSPSIPGPGSEKKLFTLSWISNHTSIYCLFLFSLAPFTYSSLVLQLYPHTTPTSLVPTPLYQQ